MRFAQQGALLAGQVPGVELGRLATAVNEVLGDVVATLHFAIDENGLRLVTGEVAAEVRLTCQRCLGGLTIPLSAMVSLAFIHSDSDAKTLPKHIDPWLISADQSEIDLYEVLEEELLLCLPIVASHSHECVDKQLYSRGEVAPDSGKNPFQVLAALKVSKP